MKAQLEQALKEFTRNDSARFISLVYTSKKTGETARYTLILGANYARAYRRDLAILEKKLPKLQGVKALACQEIIESIRESLSKGIGNNSRYSCKDVMEGVERDISLHLNTGEIYLKGFLQSKVTIKEGVFKEVNSSEKTLAKKELEKDSRRGKIRQFVLHPEQISAIKANGKTLEIETI